MREEVDKAQSSRNAGGTTAPERNLMAWVVLSGPYGRHERVKRDGENETCLPNLKKRKIASGARKNNTNARAALKAQAVFFVGGGGGIGARG